MTRCRWWYPAGQLVLPFLLGLVVGETQPLRGGHRDLCHCISKYLRLFCPCHCVDPKKTRRACSLCSLCRCSFVVSKKEKREGKRPSRSWLLRRHCHCAYRRCFYALRQRSRNSSSVKDVSGGAMSSSSVATLGLAVGEGHRSLGDELFEPVAILERDATKLRTVLRMIETAHVVCLKRREATKKMAWQLSLSSSVMGCSVFWKRVQVARAPVCVEYARLHNEPALRLSAFSRARVKWSCLVNALCHGGSLGEHRIELEVTAEAWYMNMSKDQPTQELVNITTVLEGRGQS